MMVLLVLLVLLLIFILMNFIVFYGYFFNFVMLLGMVERQSHGPTSRAAFEDA